MQRGSGRSDANRRINKWFHCYVTVWRMWKMWEWGVIERMIRSKIVFPRMYFAMIFLYSSFQWIIANACGHRLCRYCWSEHFQKIIRDKNFGNSVECIAHNCDVIIDDKLVIKLVDDLQAKEKYQLCIANSFVQVRYVTKMMNHSVDWVDLRLRLRFSTVKLELRSLVFKYFGNVGKWRLYGSLLCASNCLR